MDTAAGSDRALAQQLTIVNRKGLHARASARFVRTAECFDAEIKVVRDGQVVEAPGARVRPDQAVTVAPDASLLELTPVTLLLHKPVGFEAGLGLPAGQAAHASRSQGATPATTLLSATSHLAEDASGIRVLQRHFKQLECFTPLPTEASGLVVYTQDKRIARKLAEDIESLEQECIVEVKGDIAPNGLQRLCHGLSFNGRPLPPIKVSWQNETKLRFALKGIRPGQIPAMCEAVGLAVVAFPGALKRYPAWLESVDKDGLYFEQNNQELQVKLIKQRL